MNRDLLRDYVKQTLENELKSRLSDLVKSFIDKQWESAVDNVVTAIENDVDKMKASLKREAYDEAYQALKKEYEEKEDAAFKRGVKYGKGIVSKVDEANRRSDDAYSELLDQLFSGIFK